MPYNPYEQIESMPESQAIENHIHRARQIAIRKVRNLARKILRNNRGELNEFLMAMGSWFFVTHKGECVYAYELEHIEGIEELTDFIDYWDGDLKLTGEGIRFTWDGEIVTNW
jgi:hypothetical protein